MRLLKNPELDFEVLEHYDDRVRCCALVPDWVNAQRATSGAGRPFLSSQRLVVWCRCAHLHTRNLFDVFRRARRSFARACSQLASRLR